VKGNFLLQELAAYCSKYPPVLSSVLRKGLLIYVGLALELPAFRFAASRSS
jgi:hypothetical protein